MRWKSSEYLRDREGEERVKRVFCFVPWKFGKYVYWLVSLDMLQRIKKVDVGGTGMAEYAWKWRNVKPVKVKNKGE